MVRCENGRFIVALVDLKFDLNCHLMYIRDSFLRGCLEN